VPKAVHPVDCSSLSEGLFESELFGHVRGAFTGHPRDSLGFIRAADGGTLFLDEIGELAASTQAKLLRVLQERRVVPVGETRGRPVDIPRRRRDPPRPGCDGPRRRVPTGPVLPIERCHVALAAAARAER
jgi:hypothetical protein